MQLPGTMGIDADRSAADLPREFVAALQSPDAVVEIDIEPAEPDRPTLVLAAVDATRPPDRRLRAELSAADAVVAEDAEARRFARRAGEQPRRNDADRRRTLVLATRELPGATVLDALADAGTAVETIGLLPQLAAAAACPSRAPVTIGSGRPVDALHRAPAAHRVVVRTEPDDLADLLAGVQELRPGTQAVITQQFTRPVRALHGAVPELPVDEVVYCCVSPAPAAGLDPPVAAAVRALLADGVPTRSAARALAELSGLSRRDAYELVLGMAGRGHGTPGTGPTASR
jgi:hypothetical protein